ncbi:MAG: hypothetical protein ACQER7_03780 [Bacteroidota bacterium]
MKNTRITIKYNVGQSETRKALEWAVQKADQCENISELTAVWNQFLALQSTWQFRMKIEIKALSWALPKVNQVETLQELTDAWNEFPLLQENEQFLIKCKLKKKEILAHV